MDTDTQNQPEPSASTQVAATFTPPSDPSKYIRTYAKDVAHLTNTPVPVSAPVSPEPFKEGSTTTVDGVSTAEFDASPVNYSTPASPKEFKQEQVTLSASDSDDLFTKSDDGESKEEILARLRAKVAASTDGGGVSLAPSFTQAPIPNVAPTPVTPIEPIRTAAPTFVSALEPVAPMPQVKKDEPVIVAPMPAPPIPKGPSPLHTFSSDFADHIDSQKSSTFSVLAAQSDAGQTPRSTVQKGRRNIFPLLAGVAMVVIGTIAIGAAYLYTRNGLGTTPIVSGVPSLITFDESVPVSGEGQALMQSIAEASQGTSVSGNIIVTYPADSGTVLIRALSLPAPDILLRNIDDSSTVGFVHAGSESRPFIVFKVNSYERTFAGMLAWEATMGKDLLTFYPPYVDSLSTSASSTPAFQGTAYKFTDAIVSNYDVRVLRDSSGRSLLLYGYRGKDTLIIARDEAAFTALVTRLSAGGH